MNIILLTFFLLISTIACDISNSKLNKKNNNYNIITKNISNTKRQKNISSDFYKDNFDFEQFKDVDWNDINTYGTTKNLVTKSNYEYNLPTEHVLNLLGANKNDYILVNIAGDGNCWARAGIQQALFLILNNQEIFDNFIKQIPIIAEKYKDIEGFSDRFLANDLIILLNKLKSLPPKERLSCFNKDKVDNFLQYTFRAILAANSAVYNSKNKELIKKFLTMSKWHDAKALFDVAIFFAMPNDKIWYSIGSDAEQIIKYSGANNVLYEIFPEDGNLFNNSDDGDNEVTQEEKIEILQNAQVQAIHVNGNHYNLLVNKKSAALFGLE